MSATCIQLPFGCAASCLRGAPSARDAPTHTRCLWCTHAGALLEREIELAFFVPLIIGHGGNSGGQAVSTVIRSIGRRSPSASEAISTVATEALAGAPWHAGEADAEAWESRGICFC